MGGGSKLAKEHPYEYLSASALAAIINYPLWRASAVGQSGFSVNASSFQHNGGAGALVARRFVSMVPPSLLPYVHAFTPPYKGMAATILGMTWARAAIFWGSDYGKDILMNSFPSLPTSITTLFPPLVVSIGVQCVNQPVVRASITLQNPESNLPHIRAAVQKIYTDHGLKGLWHGTSAGILKTVPKYCTAIIMKDYMENVLSMPDPSSPTYHFDQLKRSASKSAMAGIAGAVLTNPLDVIRNEMFKTNKSLIQTVDYLWTGMGSKFLIRGMGKNVVAVAVPVASTIFFTDMFIHLKLEKEKDRLNGR